jgi:integrase/recombinase XerD
VSRHGKSVTRITNDPNQAFLDEFCDALWLEDGLARNTLESYRRDVRQFGEWLKAHRGIPLVEAGHGDIQAYLGYRYAHKARDERGEVTVQPQALLSPCGAQRKGVIRSDA